ncbi:MAG TPA: hypothetical protein ENJ09_00625, partial [Planctomycetes bacterium]|nr:hypothetical protein [Planctomycetota bacterium]
MREALRRVRGAETMVGGEEHGAWGRAFLAVGRFLVGLPIPLAVLVVLAWMGLIWSLSSQTFEAPPEVASALWSFCANLAHAPLFGILALLFASIVLRVGMGDGWPRLRAWQAGVTVAFVLAWALLDEWHQSMTPGRDSSLLDVVTDLVGAICVLAVIAILDPARPD